MFFIIIICITIFYSNISNKNIFFILFLCVHYVSTHFINKLNIFYVLLFSYKYFLNNNKAYRINPPDKKAFAFENIGSAEFSQNRDLGGDFYI